MLLLRLIHRALRLAVGLAFLAMIVAVVVQVVSRVALPWSPVWTEELSRFALLYLVAFAAPLALRAGDLVNVDVLVLALPPGARRLLEILVLLLCAGFCALLVRPALLFTEIGAFQTSPALGWRMTWIHATVLLAPALLGLAALERAAALALRQEG